MNKQKSRVVIALVLVLVGVVLLSLSVIAGQNVRGKTDMKNLFSEINQNGVSMSLYQGGSSGYLVLGNTGEALCKTIVNGRDDAQVYLTNGNCVCLDDQLTTSKCKNPVSFIETLAEYEDSSFNIMKASKLTGSDLDNGKKGYVVEIKGLDKCQDALSACTDLGAEALLSYGVKESDDVSLVITIYRGVSIYTDDTNKTRNIVDNDIEGVGSLQLDLVISNKDGNKAYVLMAMATRSVGSSLRLGSQIYTCTERNYSDRTVDKTQEILTDLVNSINQSLGIEDISDLDENSDVRVDE